MNKVSCWFLSNFKYQTTYIILLCGFLFICTSYLTGCYATAKNNSSRIASTEKLLKHFEQVTFVDEYDDERQYAHIRKWAGPIRIAVTGDNSKYYHSAIENNSSNLSLLTDLSIEVISDETEVSNFKIHFVPWDDIEMLAKPHSPNPEWLEIIVEDSSCLFIYKRNKKYEIKQAYIFISNEESPDSIKSCLLEEMTQALGFPNDSELIQPSVFNQWDHLQNLSVNDRIIIQTLYDDRLVAGMPKEEALKQARIILEEKIHKK